ncbi:MAG: PAS domain S-box protein [Syntrophorhabdaceae bacterium]|nr:PAS domain S-box protein [Syntrophorhabdaceae bacterium]
MKRDKFQPFVVPLLLILASFFGNYFSIPLFFGADFLFGSIFVFILLYLYGPIWGIIGAIIGHGYTYFLWGHPYGFFNFLSETVFIAIFMKKGRRNFILMDGLFWILFGIWFVLIEHGVIMNMGRTTTSFIMLKQSINGVFNATIASLAISYIDFGRLIKEKAMERRILFRQSIFNLLMIMVLFPTLFFTAIQINHEKRMMEEELIDHLNTTADYAQSKILNWFNGQMKVVEIFALIASDSPMRPSPRLQRTAEILRGTSEGLVSLHVEDARGISIAFDPPFNTRGASNIGLDFSWREWFQAVKETKSIHVSEVFIGKTAIFQPIIQVSYPVMKGDRFMGVSTAALNLKKMDDMLRSFRTERALNYTLLDNKQRVIATTEDGLRIMDLWALKKKGKVTPLKNEIRIWQPEDGKLPTLTRWKNSFYIKEVIIPSPLSWKIIVEAPISPLQHSLYTLYIKNLLFMAFFIVIALVLSFIFSHTLTRPLAGLLDATSSWLSGADNVRWPSSPIFEIDSLIENFKEITGTLEKNFNKIEEKNAELARINESLKDEMAERLRIEEALRLNEERFRAIADYTYGWENWVDPEGKIIWINPGVERITGYTVEEYKKLADETPQPLIIDEDRERMARHFKAALQGGSGRDIEFRIMCKDGSIKWVSLSYQPIFDSKGLPLGHRSSIKDITERKKVEEEALRLSRESSTMARIGLIVSSTLDLDEILEQFAKEVAKLVPVDGITIALIDGEKHIVRIGYSWGITVEDRDKGDVFPLQGTVAEKIYREKAGFILDMEDREEIARTYPTLLRDFDAGVRSRMNAPLIYRDRVIGLLNIKAKRSGAFTYDDLRLTEAIANQIAGAVANAQIYQELKSKERALRESEAKYRSVVDNSLVAFCIIQDNKFRFVNKRLCEMTGYSMEEIYYIDPLSFVHPDDRKKVTESLKRRLAREVESETYEFRMIKKDGTVLSAMVLGGVIEYEGKPATTSTILDITKEKALENQLLQAQKMEAIGALAGGIAHDFNNILMTILGYTSLMLMEMDKHDKNYERLKIIESQVQSGADLTRQLLGFARGGKYEVKTTNINGLLVKTADMFGRTKREINIYKKLADNLWPVDVDRGQMEQVFLNLFVNAWQAMPGGGALYIETKNITLDESTPTPYNIPPGRYIKISITDTGVGMDEATMQRIFEPFFTTKELGRGTGLGLASVYGIIKNHGGAITVYSEKGKGSTFNIYLKASDKAVVEERREVAEIQKGQELILLIDDQEMILDVGKEMLKTLGYKVLCAKGGLEAIEIYKKEGDHIALVILDMIMPGMTGEETYVKLKEINPSIKVILSSGYSMNSQATSIMEKGCNGFIQKPFNMVELSAKIKDVLK